MIDFQNTNIYFEDKGAGFPVVLLHGYLENSEIWGSFFDRLATSYRVIVIDLPGHGRSGLLAPVHTMEMLAQSVDAVLQHLGIQKAFVVGHSMGGYVALALLAHFRTKVAGLCLFHSHPLADNEEKKKSRDLEIKIIKQGRKELLMQVGAFGGFAAEKAMALPEEVERARQIARSCSDEGSIALLEGMKQRPDRQQLLKDTPVPVLFILGKQDKFISWELMENIANRGSKGEVLLLQESGHMGFIEEPDICLVVLSSIIEQFKS